MWWPGESCACLGVVYTVASTVAITRPALTRAGRTPRMVGLAATTPGRLGMITAGLVALTMAAGAASVLAVQDTAATLDELSTRSAPLSIAAQQVYRSLSDADATAASAFLSGGI